MLDKSQIITGLLEVMESNLRRQFNANKNASDGAINAESGFGIDRSIRCILVGVELTTQIGFHNL